MHADRHGTLHDAGTVASLWRYPVKSMAGEHLDAVTVTERGLDGDRAYALVDTEDGRVATAKNPRKWPRLFELSAALHDGGPPAGAPRGDIAPVRITMPDGTRLTSAQPDAEQALSRLLGRDVRIRRVDAGDEPVVESASQTPWRARSEEYLPDLEGLGLQDTVADFDLPVGTFFDSAVVHLLTTATLARLQELHPEGRPHVRRFRPNVVVDSGDAAGFVEDQWVGRTMRLGGQVRLNVTGPCARCVMVTLPQGDLPKDTTMLRTAARHNGAHVGVYASVLSGGRVATGDRVTLE